MRAFLCLMCLCGLFVMCVMLYDLLFFVRVFPKRTCSVGCTVEESKDNLTHEHT